MKKILFIFMLAAAQTVCAQQLANTTFDATWVDCYPWEAGNYVSSPRGKQPEGWCISNVSQSALPIVGEEVTPGANGSGKAVKVMNVKASIGDNTAPGYITLGTAWATAETMLTSVRNADGGVFGGIPFTYHPEAVRLTYKCDRSAGEENMSVIAYMWKGTWTQKNVPSNTAIGFFSWGSASKVTMTNRINNILGKDCLTGGVVNNGVRDWQISKTDDAELIASLEYYSKAAVSTWTTQEFPLDYKSNTAPEMLNIVIASNGLFDDRSTIKENNSVTIDDVELVYWHALSALSFEGATLSFDENTTSYDLSSVEYDEAKLSYTIKGQAATATQTYDEETAVLTIRVEGEDIASNPSSYTEYTVQFKVPEVGPQVVSSKTYSEDLYVTVAGQTSDKQVADVVVETLDNGNINFVLKNFMLGGSIAVGNIAVNDIEVAADGTFAFKGGIELTEGDATVSESWLGPSITEACKGSVPLDLSGKFIGEDHIIVYIFIDIADFVGYPVEVHLGYARAMMAVNAEAKYGTFCAPYAVEVPADVQAYTVPSVATNGKLTLTEVANTIPANTPVVLYAEAGLEAVETFGVAEDGTPVAGLLTGVFEETTAPVGSYVLQNLNEKVGFYQVAAGSQPTVGANRCYLTASSSIKAFFFDEDATGIANMKGQNDQNSVIYNLAGQRLNKVQKGINIINGKKILK